MSRILSIISPLDTCLDTSETARMQITVNNESRDLEGDGTLSSLLLEMDVHPDRVAVMIDGDVIKKQDISTAKLSENSRVDILTLAAGG